MVLGRVDEDHGCRSVLFSKRIKSQIQGPNSYLHNVFPVEYPMHLGNEFHCIHLDCQIFARGRNDISRGLFKRLRHLLWDPKTLAKGVELLAEGRIDN